MNKRLAFGLAAAALAVSSFANGVESGCPLGAFPGQLVGPFDYNIPSNRPLFDIVIKVHFTPGVETLSKAATGSFAHDIEYTLARIPNHPRALQTFMRLGQLRKSERPDNSEYSIGCYLDRAIYFVPNDPVPRMLKAKHLASQGKQEEALQVLLEAEKLIPMDANLAYNLGLVYFDLKQYGASLEAAHRAYLAGFPLPGLREKLKRAGQWREPVPKAIDSNPAPDSNVSADASAANSAAAPASPTAKSEAAPAVTSPADATVPAKP